MEQDIKRRRAQAERRRRRRIRQLKRRIFGTVILLVLVVVSFQFVRAAFDRHADITIKADAASMIQEEALPAFTAQVTCEEDKKKLQKIELDEESGYTAWDLVEELKSGEGYTLSCDGDGKEDGKFPIHVILSDDIKKKLGNEWEGKVNVELGKASLEVKNKTGEWAGDKFKKWDGGFVENDFVKVKGKTYYFGEDGIMATGWTKMEEGSYYFDEKGVMQASKWMDTDDGKKYLNDDGKMATGWVELDGAEYYFDPDGIMAIGEQQVGVFKCVFGKDGKLKSKESNVDPDKPMMALTFDDGPGDRTGELLDALKKYDAHATFFMQGVNIPGHEAFIKRMKEEGHELANHTYNHPDLAGLSGDKVREQVNKVNEMVQEACGAPTTLVRPPYGSVNDNVKANMDWPMILWDVDTLDWKTLNVDATIKSIMDTAGDGSIVLMHDIHSPTIDAAIEVIPKLIDKGYQLVTVSEMAAAKGVDLENGAVYTDFRDGTIGALKDSGSEDEGTK